jgi:hypothetical protein
VRESNGARTLQAATLLAFRKLRSDSAKHAHSQSFTWNDDSRIELPV